VHWSVGRAGECCCDGFAQCPDLVVEVVVVFYWNDLDVVFW